MLEKCIERRVRPRQAEGLLWRLDGKGETIRYGGRPALVDRSPVRPAEGHHFSPQTAKPRCLNAMESASNMAEVTVIAADASAPALTAFGTFPTG
jgi:hypothetical protein